MKNIILSLLFILTVSFAFANDIKKDDDNKGKKQVETKQTTKAIEQKTQSAKPDAHFTCAKEENGAVVSITVWAPTGGWAMSRCERLLGKVHVE